MKGARGRATSRDARRRTPAAAAAGEAAADRGTDGGDEAAAAGGGVHAGAHTAGAAREADEGAKAEGGGAREACVPAKKTTPRRESASSATAPPSRERPPPASARRQGELRREPALSGRPANPLPPSGESKRRSSAQSDIKVAACTSAESGFCSCTSEVARSTCLYIPVHRKWVVFRNTPVHRKWVVFRNTPPKSVGLCLNTEMPMNNKYLEVLVVGCWLLVPAVRAAFVYV